MSMVFVVWVRLQLVENKFHIAFQEIMKSFLQLELKRTEPASVVIKQISEPPNFY